MSSFKSGQMQFERVRTAAREKEESLKKSLAAKKLPYPPASIFVRVLKAERVLEVWAAPAPQQSYVLAMQYRLCATSGTVGPKRKQGDAQVPEGFYQINRFNPLSNFYLSLGLDYPNRSDEILGSRGKLGGDIFIHGGCATIGCMPITDDGIKELYLLAVEVRSNGQERIPVHIYPARLDNQGFEKLKRDYRTNPGLIQFWEQLKPGYDFFENHHRPPSVSVDQNGRYVIKS
ncbi:MAG TPA: L,D-transpeptidase family protein [Blastocatellia bacterium]|nr:L,D-transpeptidase family protein [Blastocatellia bacterium]